MTWEVFLQAATVVGIGGGVVFGFLTWLRSRMGEARKAATEESQTAVHLAAMGAKLEVMAKDSSEIKRDLKEVAADGRAYREAQIRHETLIEGLDHRMTRLEVFVYREERLPNEAR